MDNLDGIVDLVSLVVCGYGRYLAILDEYVTDAAVGRILISNTQQFRTTGGLTTADMDQNGQLLLESVDRLHVLTDPAGIPRLGAGWTINWAGELIVNWAAG